ncbi:MAG: hypothetical protein GX464_04025, partial [Holophagae bacterium]|nr:hypothetical protein [Holophagae bacterium]
MRSSSALHCVAVTLLAATLAGAQDKPAASKAPLKQVGGLRFVDVSEITIVNVEVSVRDRSGPVFGLSAADFEVYQDGKLQALTNFYFFTSKREGAATTAAPAALHAVGRIST